MQDIFACYKALDYGNVNQFVRVAFIYNLSPYWQWQRGHEYWYAINSIQLRRKALTLHRYDSSAYNGTWTNTAAKRTDF